MTIWKREKTHFNYYITNERKQPHIYVEALGAPSASTEKLLKNNGFKFDRAPRGTAQIFKNIEKRIKK